MPPVIKNDRVTKKTRPVKKKITRAAKQAESDTADEDATYTKSILTALTAVVATLS